MRKQREVNLIVIHCSATREDVDYSAEQLERDHRSRGFQRTGYHFYIRRDGEILPMRPLNMVGAHARGYNRHSVGICYEGGLDAREQAADTRTLDQKESLVVLLDWLLSHYPDSRICGHRDLSKDLNGDGRITPEEWIKLCPCFDAEKEYWPLTLKIND